MFAVLGMRWWLHDPAEPVMLPPRPVAAQGVNSWSPHAPACIMCRRARAAPACPFQEYAFGPWPIAADEVFATSPHCFAFVNLKPVVRRGAWRRADDRAWQRADPCPPALSSRRATTHLAPPLPQVPGHVLVSPKRVVARFADLSAAEVSDLW